MFLQNILINDPHKFGVSGGKLRGSYSFISNITVFKLS